MQMTTPFPARKVMAGTLAAALSTILIFVVNRALAEPLPIEMTGALQTLLVFVVGYFVPPAASDRIETADPGTT